VVRGTPEVIIGGIAMGLVRLGTSVTTVFDVELGVEEVESESFTSKTGLRH
jgi:hypothetical protein